MKNIIAILLLSTSLSAFADGASPLHDGTGMAFADAAELPRFVDAMDACETLWRSEKYEQLDGYYALSLLREKGSEAKQLIKEYVEREDSSIGADEAKRMSVWALLQFAHDDPEVASYLKRLPAKVDAANWKTKAYLEMAVRHLDEGCSRRFQCSGAGDSKSRKDVAPQKTGSEGKYGGAVVDVDAAADIDGGLTVFSMPELSALGLMEELLGAGDFFSWPQILYARLSFLNMIKGEVE